MSECLKNGCKILQTHCVECGRLVCEKILPKQQEWISVKDELPEIEEKVLGHSKDGSYYVCWREIDPYAPKESWKYSDCCGCQVYDLEYWTTLPEKPQ